MSSQHYRRLLKTFSRVSQNSTTLKAPNGYNQHLLRTHLFEPHQDPLKSNPFLMTMKQKADFYDREAKSSTMGAASALKKETVDTQFISDFPLPAVLQRHLKTPTVSLLTSNSGAKITGFRIQVTGRKGTRSSKQVMGYGRIDTAAIGKSYVDFGKSNYVHKKGATGIKVWVGYA